MLMPMKCSLLSRRLCLSILFWLSTTAAFSRSPACNTFQSGTGVHPVCRLARCGTLSYQSIDLQPPNDRGKLGVTSTVALPSTSLNYSYCSNPSAGTCWVFLGTKSGDLVTLPFEYNNTWQLSQQYSVNWLPPAVKPNKTFASPPLPIYSLAAIRNGRGSDCQLLAGGADRYISVWKVSEHTKEMVQRLGPHTGWVKSLLYVASSPRQRLYSIGCNRIECWVFNENGKWTEKSAVAINSSPTRNPSIFSGGSAASVCTLSSDLLCLELCSPATSTLFDSVIFAAGGVDGRIHFFLDTETGTQQRIDNIATVVAHQGRVNALSFDEQSQLLFSGSHDGSVHCWKLSFNGGAPKDPDKPLSPKLKACLVASYGFSADTRVTALSCSNVKSTLNFLNGSVDLLVGTQNGQIHLLSLVLSTDELNSRRQNFASCDCLYIGNESDTLTRTLRHPPILHSFCRLIDNDFDPPNRRIPSSFVVGHSQGIGLVTLARDV